VIPHRTLIAYGWLAIPFWVFDKRKLKITWANVAALRFWNAGSMEELSLRDFSDITEVARARLNKVHEAALRGQCLEEQWTLYPLGHPKQVVLQSNVVVAEDGSLDGLLFCANNLRALPDAELRGVRVLQYTPLLIAFYSIDGETRFQNPAAAEAWSGLQSNESKSPLEDMFVDKAIPAQLLEAGRSGRSFAGNFDMHTRRGIRTYAIDCRPVADPLDGSAAIELSATDITEYKAVERERDLLREAQVQEAKADALSEKRRSVLARKLFMATASHELRTPLQTIIGCVDLLEEAPGEIRRCLPELRDAADQMSEIAADLVEFVRADRSPGLRLTEVKLADFLQRSLSAAEKGAQAKGLAFSTELNIANAFMSIDEARVRQILSNLALNAVKYTHHGRIDITATMRGSGKKSLLHVAVADTGVGMPASVTQRVLKPFVRGPGSDQIDPQGLGMGLAIVQSHLAELGGTFSIDSTPGSGTTVSITVPCSPAGEAADDPT
jgi:signal transduction histidine kinase